MANKDKNQSFFTRMAMAVAKAAGKPATFAVAVGIVIVWAASGPAFGFGDTWQLVINTGTTIVTFLMVFLIQNTQNRDTEAMQIKLDELINALQGANDALLDLEELDEKTLDAIRAHYTRRAAAARKKLGCEDSPEREAEGD
ncbi:low affinity iron permease family protein [Luteibacter flocculans]|uniref:Low affinity iron permease family protein n=1 Tax=Luteibacter flocculans TaxID=2780091 RepID=A0ABY4SZH6_9GAMM|nr:low affinity iron permease family protein [Luteibacter flocculans]